MVHLLLLTSFGPSNWCFHSLVVDAAVAVIVTASVPAATAATTNCHLEIVT